MKIIFLDIDGVLNSTRSVIAKIGPTAETSEEVRELTRLDEHDHDMITDNGLEYGARFALETVDPVCVALLNRLLEQSDDIVVVLSSTHRRFFCHSKVTYGSNEHLRRLRLYLGAMGVKVPEAFSVTSNTYKPRGEQIDEWLNHAYENGIYDDGDLYVILDDSTDMLPNQPLIRIDPEHGFDFADYAEACKHLGLKEPNVVLL